MSGYLCFGVRIAVWNKGYGGRNAEFGGMCGSPLPDGGLLGRVAQVVQTFWRVPAAVARRTRVCGVDVSLLDGRANLWGMPLSALSVQLLFCPGSWVCAAAVDLSAVPTCLLSDQRPIASAVQLIGDGDGADPWAGGSAAPRLQLLKFHQRAANAALLGAPDAVTKFPGQLFNFLLPVGEAGGREGEERCADIEEIRGAVYIRA